MNAPATDVHERVLVLMPSTRDAERTAGLFRSANVPATVCPDLVSLCRELRVGAGAVLLTDDSILHDTSGQLAETMRAQPSWSNVPIVAIARESTTQRLQKVASPALDGFIVVERPVRMHSLLSVMHSALSNRQHQYQNRDAMQVRERQAAALQQQEERLRFALAAGQLGSWTLDLESMELECSDLCKVNFGRPLDEPFTYEQLHASIHPEDHDRVVAALEASIGTGVDYDVEYRVMWPSGEERWVMVRGRAPLDTRGRRRYMTGISSDIDATKRMHDALVRSEAELAEQAQQLRDTDRRKDEFLATLAHELRNPLAPIRTGIDVLRSTPPAATAERTLGVMDRQITHMVRLIDDLLDVSRITRGVLELRKEPVALGVVLGAAVEASRSYVARARHDLQVRVPDSQIMLDVDGTRIAQAVSNLLINASKYTMPGGHLVLSAEVDGSMIRIAVQDDGIGIPPERLHDVFEMFSQVDPALEGAQNGLGIGLALVRTVVELHGGVVRASSAGRGQGSTFFVELPFTPAPEVGAESQASSLTPSAAARRILVVDDNDDAAEMLSLMLESDGYVTMTAHDGESAMEVADEHLPDVVILDIGLPGISGYDVARELRTRPRTQGLGLIALTGWGTSEDKKKARDAGFDVHLTKPIDGDQLHAALLEVERIVRGNQGAA